MQIFIDKVHATMSNAFFKINYLKKSTLHTYTHTRVYTFDYLTYDI